MPVITLPDEAQRAFPNPVSALEVARSISPALRVARLLRAFGRAVVRPVDRDCR